MMFLRLAPQPWRWRWTSMVYHLEMYRSAQRADHHADQLPGRGDRHPAGHLPADPLRRRGLRRQSGRRPGLARARRADDLDHDRGAHRIGDHRRDRLDENARGDRRAQGDGARSAGSADHSAACRVDDRPADFDLPRRPGSDRRRPHRQLALRRDDARGDLSDARSRTPSCPRRSWSASSRRRSWRW